MRGARAGLPAAVAACACIGALAAGAGRAGAQEPALPAEAGGVRIEVSVDRTNVTVGDPIAVTVRLAHPADVRVTSFDPERSLGDIALLDRRSGEAKKLPDGRVQETRVLRVARYETGAATIPSFEAAFVDAAGTEGRVASRPVAFTVGSVLAEGDTGPADIKSAAAMPERPLWPWIAAAALVVAALLFWLWQRRRARLAGAAPAAPAVPPRPAHETAYAELERLLSSGLLDKGRLKEFYIGLAEILRRYLAARFGVDTFERTTFEILEALRLVRLPVRGMTATAEFFGACDMVKFARHVPPSEETRATVERAYRLIDETREQDRPAQRPEGAVAGGVR